MKRSSNSRIVCDYERRMKEIERKGNYIKKKKQMMENYDRKVNVKNKPYLQDIVNVHHFFQNLPVPVRNRFNWVNNHKLLNYNQK